MMIIKPNNIKKNLFNLYFSLLITLPFFNESLVSLTGFSFYPILVVFPIIIVLILLFLNIRVLGSFQNEMILISLLLIPIYVSFIQGNLRWNISFSSVALLFLIIESSILSIFYQNDDEWYHQLRKMIIIFSVLGLILDIGSFMTLMTGVSNTTRMIYSANPLSIATLAAIFGLLIIESRTKILRYLILLSTFILVSTFSRGPLIAFSFVLLYRLLLKKHYKTLLVMTFISIFVILSIFNLRSITASSDLSNGRFDLYVISLNHYYRESNLILGVGYQGLETLEGTRFYPHNIIVEYLTIIGPIFTITFLCILITLTNRIKIAMKQSLSLFPGSILLFLFCFFQFSMSSIDFLRILIPLIILTWKRGVKINI